VTAPLYGPGDPLAPHSLSATERQEVIMAERLREPFLALRDELGLLKLFKLRGDQGTVTLGRTPATDLAITWDGEVSSLHAEIEFIGGAFTIIDDGLSTNGTFVNERRISGRHRLRDGDRVRVGKTVLVFRSGETAAVFETIRSTADVGTIEITPLQRQVLISLCRPMRDGATFATPATNQQIASELFLSVSAVKMHLRSLFAKFALGDMPQNQKRARLAEGALQLGVITHHELN
jgi:FHA domain